MSTFCFSRERYFLSGTRKAGISFAGIFFTVVLISLLAAQTTQASKTVVAWGDNSHSQSSVPPNLTNIVEVAAGTFHSLALENNGGVIGWGDDSSGETTFPAGLSNVTAIAAGDGFSLTLQSDGTFTAWGNPTTVPTGLTNVVAISASANNAMALENNGTVIDWGTVSSVPANVTNVVAIAAGDTHCLALKGDGTVVAWGDNTWGQSTVPPNLTNVVALAAGEYHSLALKADGTVVAWGDNTWGESAVPAGLNNVVAIAASGAHSLALKSDGTVIAWGDNTYGQSAVPPGLSLVTGIAAGDYHSLAVIGDGSPVITVQPISQYDAQTGKASFWVMAAGSPPLTYQWQENGTNIIGATGSSLVLTNLSTFEAGVYSVMVSNSLGSTMSSNVVLPPAWRRPFFLIQPQSQNLHCGDPVTFQVDVGGTQPLSYQWWFNGMELPDATNAILDISQITADQSGDYYVVVTNVNGSSTSQVASLTIASEPPLITSPLAATGKQGVNFSYTITGLHEPITFSASGLPAGLDINQTNGAIQGIPLESGLFNVTIGTANLCSSASTNLVLTITSSIPVITSSATASGAEQTPFNYKITATESPTSFGAENLPQGLNIDPTTGIISGSPLYAGVFTTTISASNVWGVGTASLELTLSNAPIAGLSIANVTTNYLSPYLLDFKFSLRDNNDPTKGDAVVTDPSLLSAKAFEDSNSVSPSETAVNIEPAAAKVLKAYLALDFSESIASIADNGDTNNNGISDAVDSEVAAAQEFVNQQPADAQIGVYEFHRDDEAPQKVSSLTTDKAQLDSSIAGIWTNYVQGFSSGSRCWDALVAAIKALGPMNSDEEHYVIFCSDGEDTSSTNTFQDVINTASNADVQVYCVGFGREVNAATLQAITTQTEGRYYAATNASQLATDFALIGKDLSGQYILRWATLNRSTNAFMPSFQITYQGLTADSPSNPPPVITGTNYVTVTNTDGTLGTNQVFVYTTNYIISPYLPSLYAGDVTVGSLRLLADADVHPSGITLRATYVPRYIRQIRLHYRANWPCTVSLDSTNPGQMLYGWTLVQTNDGAGGQWLLLNSPNPQDPATSIPFASFGNLLTFYFQDSINASNAFSVFDVDNNIYTNAINQINTNATFQSFALENTNEFITAYPALPYGTPVPWLIQYGFTNASDWANIETNDLDGNGMLVWQDYVAGLNPTNASSVFTVRSLTPTGEFGHYQITFNTVLNRTYRVETSTNLVNWQTLQDDIAGTGGDVTVTDTRNLNGINHVFYRVVVSGYSIDTVGLLSLAFDTNAHPSSVTLSVTNVPDNIRQFHLHYRANWPCTVSLDSTNPGQILYGWTLVQTNDGAGGQWLLLNSPNPQDPATSIPFASLGNLLTFYFQDSINASNAFSVFDVDNTIYAGTGGQSFALENTSNLITTYPALPYGTPVPWLVQYGFTNANDWASIETNDLDGNGMLVWQDYVAGLNPTNTSSVFTVRSLTSTSGHYQITFSTALNRTYRVETSTNLVNWQTLQDNIAGTGGDVTVTDNRSPTGSQAYYRVVVF
jgi:Regulator of chromosome condensation (RCC1) repeat/von Willebrand factor type A domain/Putative Ig domain/Immunoglobulin domain